MTQSQTQKPTYRILVVDDREDQHALLRALLRALPSDEAEFRVHFWGENSNESFDDTDAIAQWILDHQKDYDGILLDTAFNTAQEQWLKANTELKAHEIAKLPIDRWPGGFRVLRGIRDRNRVPVSVWTWFNSDGWALYAKELKAEWTRIKEPTNGKAFKKFLIWLCGLCALSDRLAPYLDALKGTSPAMTELKDEIAKIVRSGVDSDIHIVGPVGSGKQLVAEALGNVLRGTGPFLTVNCAGLKPQLAESQLFGHKKGAFTGADKDYAGPFETAHGGGVFLDEIHTLHPAVRAKLLLALENRTFTPLGGTEELRIRARVISATSENLAEWVERKEFSGALYSRLARIVITVPPLNSRREDIETLVTYFLQVADSSGRGGLRIEPAGLERLKNHDWSVAFNCRGLRNKVTALVTRTRSPVITDADVAAVLGAPAPGAGPADGSPPTPPGTDPPWVPFNFPRMGKDKGVRVRAELKDIKEYFKRHFVLRGEEALRICDGDTKAAQRMLGVKPSYWHDRMNRKRKKKQKRSDTQTPNTTDGPSDPTPNNT